MKRNISQKSPGRRPRESNAWRAKKNISKKSPGRRPRKEQRLEGEKALAAGNLQKNQLAQWFRERLHA
ncbi:MAG: hypothetical protein FWB81_08715 [Cystobacterineae bacterium]|nr:hypothetical protein [Cystobacterineae bacterium]